LSKINIGSDHAGFDLKLIIIEHVKSLGYEVNDIGCYDKNSVDYPDIAAETVKQLPAILICGTGIGMSIAANKVKGVRAALCHSEYDAEMTRRHNNANVLCIGARTTGEEIAKRMVERFLAVDFESDTVNHVRRVNKLEV
jgi:ribose 5-phosphate isomerase B